MDGAGFVGRVSRGVGQDPWPVLTLHAEMEGQRFLGVAEALLMRWRGQGVRCLPLNEIATAIRAAGEDRIPVAEIVPRPIKGRAGSVATPRGLEPSD
jgi:hypothetical protein